MVANIPDLDSLSGSWIVVSKDTGRAVAEFYDRRTVEQVNRVRYDVLTAHQYLAGLNKP